LTSGIRLICFLTIDRKSSIHRLFSTHQQMTDIAKALAFAKECLKWKNAKASTPEGIYIEDLSLKVIFHIDSAQEIQEKLSLFLGQRLFIQINRGTTSLFKWSVIVGMQDASQKSASWERARGDSEDLCDAIFDACVQAARMFER